jgi:heterogeneous nuclear ribonucleoprotein F/H
MFQFFRPLVPLNIRIILESGGRASGEADVEFVTHEEALKAMSKDKSHMSHRYIELFLNSSPGPSSGGNSSGMLGGIGNFCGGNVLILNVFKLYFCVNDI